MKSINKCAVATTVFAMLIGNATGAILLDWQDGTAGRLFSDWTVGAFGGEALPPGVSAPTNGVNQGGAFSVTGNTVENPPYGVYAALYTTDAFAGNMNAYTNPAAGITIPTDIAGMSLELTGGTPSGLGFYFQSDVNGGSVWFYDIFSVSGPGEYSASFGSATGWEGYLNNDWTGVPGSSFDAALADVSRVGFYLYYNPNENQVYGLNEFGLTVPEPETYVVLGMALLTMAFVFRKRITASLAEARAMMQV